MCKRKGRIAGSEQIARRIVVGLAEDFGRIVPCLKMDYGGKVVSKGCYLQKDKRWVVMKLERVT